MLPLKIKNYLDFFRKDKIGCLQKFSCSNEKYLTQRIKTIIFRYLLKIVFLHIDETDNQKNSEPLLYAERK